MKKNSGFTLVELVVTVGIVGLLVGIGIPAMSDLIRNDRLSGQINTLVGHLALARSEAVKRHQPVVICASSDQASCGGGWDSGWIVFADPDSSGSFTGGDELLRVQQALEGGNSFNSIPAAVVTYDSRGFAPNANGSFALCDNKMGKGKSIRIAATGRVNKGADPTC